MRGIDIILADSRVGMVWRTVRNDKAIQLKLDVKPMYWKRQVLVKFTKALGWEHLSVSDEYETPSWDVMQEMKQLFWCDDEVVFQLHPKKADYINNHDHCLHLWKECDINIKCPPTILVGFRKGHEEEDAKMLSKMQEELDNPISYQEALRMAYMSTEGNMKENIEKALKDLPVEELLKMLGGDFSGLCNK